MNALFTCKTKLEHILVVGLTKDMVKLIKIMLSWKYGPIGKHLCKNATDRPDIN